MSRLGPDQREGFRRLGVVEGYDAWACTYDQGANPLIALEEPATWELVGEVAGQRILDLGCGTGRYAVRLAEHGAYVVGIDPSAEMLAQAKRKVGSVFDLELHHGTLESMCFPDEHFDLILAALSLSHVRDLERILGESVRVLKRGGAMVISDIHPYWPVSGHDYVEFFAESGQEYRIPQYPHLIADYWRLFRAHGMQITELREPRIDEAIIAAFPSLRDYREIPLAIVLKMQRTPVPGGHS